MNSEYGVRLSPEDWHRRFIQQARWTESIRNYLYQQVGIDPSQRVLEVGCGTGVLLNELARKGYKLLDGIDFDRANIDVAMRNLPILNLCIADAHSLPYPTASFDLTFCHFLLLWVDNPIQVVREMSRATKPGRAVLAFAEPDYGGRIDFPDQLTQLGQLQTKALLNQGADPHIGRKLSSIFTQAGLHAVETGILGAQWIAVNLLEGFASEWQVIRFDLNYIKPGETNPSLKLNDLQSLDQNSREKGERVLYVPTFYAKGIVP